MSHLNVFPSTVWQTQWIDILVVILLFILLSCRSHGRQRSVGSGSLFLCHLRHASWWRTITLVLMDNSVGASEFWLVSSWLKKLWQKCFYPQWQTDPSIVCTLSLDAAKVLVDVVSPVAAHRFCLPDLASSHWVHLLCLGYFVCVRLFSCITSACMLYYCNTVRWAWLDWGLSGWLTTLLQCFDTVGWVIRLVKTVGRITYIVLVQTLNHAQSINWFTFDAWCISLYQICKKIKHLHHGFWCQKINFKNTGCLQLANDIQCHIKKNSCRVATSNRNALRLVKNFLLVSYNCKGILSSSLFQYCLWSRHLLYRLQSILNANAAALLVFSATRHEHISQLLHDIHWLWSLWSKVQFCLTVLNYHCLHNKQDKHNMALFGLLVWKFVKTVWTLNLYVIIYCAFCICTVNLSLMSLQTEILYFKFHCFL